MDIEELTKRTNLDLILADGVNQLDAVDTPALRELLSRAYDTGVLEASATPVAPGDPARAEEECDQFAVAVTLLLRNPGAGRAVAEQLLEKHHARRAQQ
jgi:hypothetical protein